MSFHFVLMGILLDGLCIVVRMAFGYVHDLKYVLRLPLQSVFIIIFVACPGLYFEINGDVGSVTDEYKEEEFNFL